MAQLPSMSSRPLLALCMLPTFLLLVFFLSRLKPGTYASLVPRILPCPASSALSMSMSMPSPTPLPISKLPDAPAMPSDRVAVCVTGALRTLHYPAVHTNILSSLITPLRAAFPNTDVFFIARMEDDPRPLGTASRRNDSMNRAAMKLFNPVEIVEYTGIDEYAADIGFDTARFVPQQGTTPASVRGPEPCFFQMPSEQDARQLHFSHSLLRTHQCLSVIKRREVARNFTYDWVYRIRPDIIFYQPLPLPSSLKRNIFYTAAWTDKFIGDFDGHWLRAYNLPPDSVVRHGPIGDQFFAAGRAVAERAFRAFEVINLCAPYSLNERNSESSLLWWILFTGLPYESIDVVWDIVRDEPPTFECPLMEYIEATNKTWDERKDMCYKFRVENKIGLPK